MQFFKDASPLNKLFFPCKPPGYGQVALCAAANAAIPSSQSASPSPTSPCSSTPSSSSSVASKASAACRESRISKSSEPAAPSSKPHVAISSDPVMRHMVFLGPHGDPCLHREFGSRHRGQHTSARPQTRRQRRCIIYFHGNFMDLGDISYTEMPSVCTHLEATLLVPEYPGYGLALGSASEGSCRRVAQQVVDYAVCNLGFRHNEIILIGRSIGSGVALQSCAHVNKHYGSPLAVVLQSGFTSLRDVARDITPLGSVLSTRFPNQDVIDGLGITNLLLVHGANDTLIPPRHSQALYDAAASVANRTIKVWPGATHNSFPGSAATHMASFLEHCTPPPERQMTDARQRLDGVARGRSPATSWLQAFGKTFTGCVPLAVREHPCSPSAYRRVPSSRNHHDAGAAGDETSDDEANTATHTTKQTGMRSQGGLTSGHTAKQAGEHLHGASTHPISIDDPKQQAQQPQQACRSIEVQQLAVDEIARRYERQMKRTEDFERSIARWSRFLGYFLPTAAQ